MLHQCHHQGYLVNATCTLPVDPCDRDISYLPEIGCSRLRCVRCGAAVRSEDGLAFATPAYVARETLSALYELPDLRQSPLIHATQPKWRLYLCRCDRWLETNYTALDPPDADDAAGKPWRCTGHPLRSLPFTYCGLPVATPHDLQSLTQRVLRGTVALYAHAADKEKLYGLLRLHSQLETDLAQVMVTEAASNLEEPNTDTLMSALWFLFFTSDHTGRQRVFELLSGSSPLLSMPTTLKLTVADQSIGDLAWHVTGPLLREPGNAQDYARARALAGHTTRSMLYALAEYDSDWLINHLEAVATAAPTQAGMLVDSLSWLPDEKRSTQLTTRVNEVLIGKYVSLDHLRAAAREFAKVLSEIRSAKVFRSPVSYLFTRLRNGTVLTLEVSKSNTDSEKKQLCLHLTSRKGKGVTYVMKEDTKVGLISFLESAQAAERILYHALDKLPVPLDNLLQPPGSVDPQDQPVKEPRIKRPKKTRKKISSLTILLDSEKDIHKAAVRLADKLTSLPLTGLFEDVAEQVVSIDGSGVVELRLAANPIHETQRFVELKVFTKSGKSWMGRWIGQGTNAQLNDFLCAETTSAAIVKNVREMMLKLILEEYL